MVREPSELTHARWVVGLCERFGCLPSKLYQEDSELIQLLNIIEQGTPEEAEPEDETYEEE